MKKFIAGWLATVVHRMDPTLGVFNTAAEVARLRVEEKLRDQWRTVDWEKALRFESIEGGDATCDHSNLTAIKKYRNQDWTQECNNCKAVLTLHNVNLGNHDKPSRRSRKYLAAQVLYLHDCFATDPIVSPLPFEDIEDVKRREYFALAERYL